MKYFLFVFAMSISFVWSGLAEACHDHGERCQVEEWRSSHDRMMEYLIIEGMTTCGAGDIRVRVYDTGGEKPKFIGIARTSFMGHTFKVIVMEFPNQPASMSIKFNVDRNRLSILEEELNSLQVPTLRSRQ